MSAAPKSKRIPPGLARVRKELPPPARVFPDKKKESRGRSKEALRRELQDSLPRKSS